MSEPQPRGAAGFPVLIAKAVEDAIVTEQEYPSMPRRTSSNPPGATNQTGPRFLVADLSKERTMSKDHQLSKQAGDTIVVALQRMTKAAADAEQQGDAWKATEIRREAAALKMQLAEDAYQKNGRVSQYGPQVRPLFKPGSTSTMPLGDDPAVKGF